MVACFSKETPMFKVNLTLNKSLHFVSLIRVFVYHTMELGTEVRGQLMGVRPCLPPLLC